MPKLPAITPKKVERILLQNGFLFVRQHGSHRIYVKSALAVTLPFHNKDLRKGTLKSIIRQSGLSVQDFLR